MISDSFIDVTRDEGGGEFAEHGLQDIFTLNRNDILKKRILR